MASNLGYSKVSQLKLDVSLQIRDYVVGGGFMFAMCSATDTYDIALAAQGQDICAKYYDGDGVNADITLDYSKTLAFTNFELTKNPLEYEYSTIDHQRGRKVRADQDYFTLFDFLQVQKMLLRREPL